MIGRIITVSKIDGIVQGIISAQDGKKYHFYSPAVYVRPGFVIEFDIIESEGKECAQLIRQAEIEYPELSNELVQHIIADVSRIVETKGFLTAVEFSQLLKDNGIQDVKMYAKNMTAFISEYLSPDYTSRNDINVNGKTCPCAIVSSEAGIGLSFGESLIKTQTLDDDSIRNVVSILMQYIKEHRYIKGAYLPELLKKAGIYDFHKYASSITSFISSYFSAEFKVENNVNIDGKNQPCIILLNDDSFQDAVVIIKQYLKEHGYIKGAHFPALLKQAGILDYHQFADSISSFISLYFNTELKAESNIYIDGKTQPCIITAIDSSLKTVVIEDMKSQLLQIIDERGFADFSLVTELLEKYYIDASVLPSSFSEFVEEEFDGLEIQDDVIIDKQYYKRVLLQKGRVTFKRINDYDDELILPPDVIVNISEEISVLISENGYILSSELPKIFNRLGVNDYKLYAESLAQFVEKYLTNFESKTHAYIGGKDYPAIIIERGQEISFFSSDDASVLTPLYESGDYYGFLSSEHFTKYHPNDVPPFFFIKALTCAKRLLTKDKNAILSLNSFQKTLLETTSGIDIIKKYKKDGIVDKEALEECFSTSIPSCTITNKKQRTKVAIELFNSIGRLAAKTHNTDYIGLIERAESCMNELYPYLLLIRIINSSGRKYELLNELCRRVKQLSSAKVVSDLTLSSPENWLYLPSIISVCEEHNALDDPPRAFLTQLFSTFVDLNALDEITPVSHLFSENMYKYFFDIYNHYDTLTEYDYQQLFEANISKEIYQKIAAQIWEKIGFVDTIPPAFLKLLAFTLKYDCEESVDEILRLRIKPGILTKKEKRLSLLSSFSTIINLLWTNDAVYGLGVYAKKCYDDLSEAVLTVNMRKNWEQWGDISEDYYSQRIIDLYPVTDNTANTVVSLFDVFRIDYEHTISLQNAYADWVIARYDFDSTLDNIASNLNSLYSLHAYEAFHRIFERIFSCNLEQTNKQLITKYINSLIFLHFYKDALIFVIENNLQEHILQVTIDICDRCGISEQTRTIFNNAWSLEEALVFAYKHYTANSTYIINTMIVLHCLMNNPFYAIYLYACYGYTIVRGHSHIYTQFLRWLGNRFTKVVNNSMTRFSVIEKAFTYLTTEQLIDFLAWCGSLKLPEKIGQTKMQTHTFAANYELLIKNARDSLKWRAFYEHIVKKPTLNAWKICVCANVISFLEGKIATEFTGIVTQMAESQLVLSKDEIPFNFLNMICPFISINDEDSIFYKIRTAMAKSDDFKTRICISPITRELNYSVQDFVKICANKFNEKNDDVYFDLIEHIGDQENMFALIDISKLLDHDEGRITILRHLCKVYDKVESSFEFRDILNNKNWNALGYIESNLVSIVRFLYGYSDEITKSYVPSWLNRTEHDIIRIKRDVASILSCYPSKQKLFCFDRETYSVPYKMIVYSIVASVLYDQDLYSNYFSCSYKDLMEWNAFNSFAYFSFKTYLFQVYHNSDYDLFYIERRYQKALLALCLIQPEIDVKIDDSSIISSMEYFGHKELSYQTKYIPFKNALISLVHESKELQNSSEIITMHKLMLFSLLNGDFCEFFDQSIKLPISATESFNSDSIKLIVSEVAYREFSVSSFKYYILHPDYIDKLLKLSKRISRSVYDVLMFLHEHSGTKSHELFFELTQADRASTCVANILNVSGKVFDEYRELLIPLLASVQLPLRLYEKLYALVAKGDTSNRYLYVLNYISTEHPQSQTVYRFLHCLQAAISKDAESLKIYYDELDFDKNLPESWNHSYIALKHYMLSDMSDNFIPPAHEGDSSFRTAKSSKYKFIEAVSGLMDIPQTDVSDIEELYAAYRASKEENKTELGIHLLMAMSKTYNKRGLPSYHEVAYIVGVEMLINEKKLTPEVRIIILSDLDNIINVLSISKQREFYSLSKKIMDKLIQDGLDIYCWCKHYGLISKYISRDEETNKELESVNTQIMPILHNALQNNCSLEQRLIDLKSLHIAAMYYSRFAGYLQKAVEHEIKHLEKGIRLHIEIVNDTCSDGCIYAQIINIGQSTVNLDNNGENHVKIAWSINDNPNEILVQTERTDTITELRHGYVSGFCVKLPVQEENISTVKITVSAYLNHTLYSRCKKTLQIDYTQETISIETKKQWYRVDSAVTDEEMLFGRENIKEQLSQSLTEGLTVLYGPSRIGKTSLLNWVRRFLSTRKVTAPNTSVKRIITVLLAGGERALKERDYMVKFFDGTPLDYSKPSEISEYLLCESIIHSFDKLKRFAVVGEELTQDLKNQIITILDDNSTNLEDRYSNLEILLRKNDTELWLLMDEFQEVVRQWKKINPITSSFALVCSDLKISDSEYPHSVRLVLCGSDDLLKQMTSTERSLWRTIIPDTGILVGPLQDKGFEKMIREAEDFPKDKIIYSDSAIDALYTYTGGIALYGKEICNTLLRRICNDPTFFTHRNTIYPSDISWAVQTLLNRQEHEQKTNVNVAGGIIHIYDAVVKHLDEDTDKLFLMYIAQWMRENSGSESFPKAVFSSMHLKDKYANKIVDSIEIAVKRGILQEQRDMNGIVCTYTFTTIFYYYAFLGINKMSCEQIERILTIPTDDSKFAIEEESIVTLSAVKEGFDRLTPDAKYDLLSFAYLDTSISSEKMTEFRKRVSGNTINTQTFIGENTGTSIGTQNNVQVTIQSMTNAFATLLSGDVSSDQYLSAFSKLPSVQTFISQENKKLLRERITDLHEAADDESIREAGYRVEELTSPAEQEMTGTYIAAAMNSTDFFKVTGEQWEKLIHISKKELEVYLPQEYITSLGFAVMLHNVFEAIRLKASEDNIAREKADAELDYCPVAIMYCKVVEALLKELHTPLYAQQIGNQTIKKSSSVVFGDLLNEDGTVNTNCKDLTIGSFSYHIVKPSNFDENNNIDHPDDFSYEPKMWMIQKITGLKPYTHKINLEWIQHAVNLAVIQGVRNKSAHEARPITKENFDWLIRTLFDDGELLRIVKLVSRKNTNKSTDA